jgi:hypothetical protein
MACVLVEVDEPRGAFQLFLAGIFERLNDVCGTHILMSGGSTRWDTPELSVYVLDMIRMTWAFERQFAGDLGLSTRLHNGDVFLTGWGPDPATIYRPRLRVFDEISDSTGYTAAHHEAVTLHDGRTLSFNGNTPRVKNYLLFTPTTGQFRMATGPQGRRISAMVVLDNGEMLVTGGIREPSPDIVTAVAEYEYVTSTAEIYSPDTGVFRPCADMRTRRAGHAIVKLPSGVVLVSGGLSKPYRRGRRVEFDNTCEFYDPAANKWTFAPPLLAPRCHHQMIMLPSINKVLVYGGSQMFPISEDKNDFPPAPAEEDRLSASGEICDLATFEWSPAPPMPVARACFGMTVVAASPPPHPL